MKISLSSRREKEELKMKMLKKMDMKVMIRLLKRIPVLFEAVPKRILDLMNVDEITRENVASHLQVI
ncbi:hypothetical protein L2E82_05966 [Cichorium intybus]|uniref:Uncharacterized protein n=1 Tax=Cichorium intybus TaxID=13427 RepID=A0ACB9H999_CICIN|nr:hypothetical protein L2E82_05966 [Cichorium intybus]